MSDSYKNHQMYDVWSVVKGWQNLHTARMSRDQDRNEIIDFYPVDSVDIDELVERAESEFPIERTEPELTDRVRFKLV